MCDSETSSQLDIWVYEEVSHPSNGGRQLICDIECANSTTLFGYCQVNAEVKGFNVTYEAQLEYYEEFDVFGVNGTKVNDNGEYIVTGRFNATKFKGGKDG